MSRIDEAWVARHLRAARVSGLEGWSVASWEGGVRLHLRVRGGELGLDLEARREGAAYATTPSLSAYLRHEGALPPGAEEVARGVLEVLRRADPGGLEVAKGEQVPEDAVAEPVHEVPRITREDEMMGWLVRAHALPAELAQAAALAWAAHRAAEPYPFPQALGSCDEEGTGPLRAWLLARWPSGPRREEVFATWGAEAAGALMDLLADLVALGVVEVTDAGLRVHAGQGADPAIWAVWLWHPAVRAEAAARWDLSAPDPRGCLDRATGRDATSPSSAR
ncbi:MAG: hypothetical protein H6732_10360 [Alphaproteobacteria bacterium]|nr:hypothetical protein [Alphaproteobacteria bacterium]